MTTKPSPASSHKSLSGAREEKAGLSTQQWMLLVFSFLLGIAAVFTVDKVFLSNAHPTGAAQAAVSQP